MPPFSMEVKAARGFHQYEFGEKNAGKSYPTEVVEKAHEEVENLCKVLKAEGVKVRRPEVCEFKEGYQTPDFHSPAGLFNAMPR